MKFKHLVSRKLAGTICFEQEGDLIHYGISIVSPKERNASRHLGKEISMGRLLSKMEKDWGRYNSRKEVIELVGILDNVGLKKCGYCPKEHFRIKMQNLASILTSLSTI